MEAVVAERVVSGHDHERRWKVGEGVGICRGGRGSVRSASVRRYCPQNQIVSAVVRRGALAFSIHDGR
ncbi:hypothetical protein GCM10020255_008820 [Rhodococcus baikonurensis]